LFAQCAGASVDRCYGRLVLHIGIGAAADVYVFGPAGARPTPLELQSVNAAAYQ
jgi:hypothetical protein